LVPPPREVVSEDATSTPTITKDEPTIIKDEPTITIVYDNTVFDDRLSADWGFAALIELDGYTILFDTGGSGAMLLGNLQALGFDPLDIDAVVLSHEHGDHVGGLPLLLAQGVEPSIYLPQSFSLSTKSIADSHGVLVEVSDPMEIIPGVYTTGELGEEIIEQALVLETAEGIVVVTGCAHPGIVEILQRAKEITGEDIDLVVGGFHLMRHSQHQIESIIDEFRSLGVRRVVPSHCTGELAMSLFAEAYGEDYLVGGVGTGPIKRFRLKSCRGDLSWSEILAIELIVSSTAIPALCSVSVLMATPKSTTSPITPEPVIHQVPSITGPYPERG
jgi:7,8-dihydropterin-6-yl-methyl-4-(beta-D-ribofuranosyl)aminobenzene 5'-phosphate synthase